MDVAKYRIIQRNHCLFKAKDTKGQWTIRWISEPHMAKVMCFSAVLNGKTKYRRIRQYLRIRADTHFFHTGYGWFPHYR
jgi:hypothetical protein